MDEFMAIQRALNHREAGTRPEFQEAVEIARGLLRVYEALGNTPAEALACSYWIDKVDVLTAFIRYPDSASGMGYSEFDCAKDASGREAATPRVGRMDSRRAG